MKFEYNNINLLFYRSIVSPFPTLLFAHTYIVSQIRNKTLEYKYSATNFVSKSLKI